jgi:hypothetical protein
LHCIRHFWTIDSDVTIMIPLIGRYRLERGIA